MLFIACFIWLLWFSLFIRIFLHVNFESTTIHSGLIQSMFHVFMHGDGIYKTIFEIELVSLTQLSWLFWTVFFLFFFLLKTETNIFLRINFLPSKQMVWSGMKKVYLLLLFKIWKRRKNNKRKSYDALFIFVVVCLLGVVAHVKHQYWWIIHLSLIRASDFHVSLLIECNFNEKSCESLRETGIFLKWKITYDCFRACSRGFRAL